MKQKKLDWNAKSRGGAWGYLFFIYIIKWIGVKGAYLFLYPVVGYFIPFAPKATQSLWYYYRNIRHVGLFRAMREVYAHYYRFGQTLIDKIAMKGGLGEEFDFLFDNYDDFLQVLNGGKGVILIGAHVGAWEIGSQFFGDYGNRMNIVMFDAEYAKIKNVVSANARKENYKIIPINTDSIEGIVKIKQALDRGEYVCFQGDRFTNEEKSIEAVFLNRKADFPAGPFLLASKMKVPVVFYYSMREGKGYRFKFRIACLKQRITPNELMAQYIDSLEEIVNAYPHQWFNFYRFWK